MAVLILAIHQPRDDLRARQEIHFKCSCSFQSSLYARFNSTVDCFGLSMPDTSVVASDTSKLYLEISRATNGTHYFFQNDKCTRKFVPHGAYITFWLSISYCSVYWRTAAMTCEYKVGMRAMLRVERPLVGHVLWDAMITCYLQGSIGRTMC